MPHRRSPLTRSEVMSRIRSKDTRPEMSVRRGLHARGFRYRLHGQDLPGRPDLILPQWGAVIQIHGCFWHGHTSCGRAPKTNRAYWGPKIERNRVRNEEAAQSIRALGWRVLIVWSVSLVAQVAPITQ